MTTTARIQTAESSHWYYPDRRPCYELPKADGKGMKSPTLADARKLGLVPSVTTLLKVLAKPQLEAWKIEQAILAVLTTPRLPGEADDAFAKRVLSDEKIQDQEASKARQLGTDIHSAIEAAFSAKDWPAELSPYVEPVLKWQNETGKVMWTEEILVGKGYAGKADALLMGNGFVLVDFKTTSKLPEKDSWLEHKLQTAAYAAALYSTANDPIRTCNVYISTKTPGQFAAFFQDDWRSTFENGFLPLIKFWQWSNRYTP